LKPFSYWFFLNSVRTIAILVFLFQKKFITVTMCFLFKPKTICSPFSYEYLVTRSVYLWEIYFFTGE